MALLLGAGFHLSQLSHFRGPAQFATPFAILILQLYARLIPFELDDAARVDGASAVQIYLRIYLPLMTPTLAVVAIYALLLAWNDYLYQAVLLSVRNMTVSVTQGQLFADVDAPYNAMMAAGIIYVLPPIVCCLPSAATSRRASRWATLRNRRVAICRVLPGGTRTDYYLRLIQDVIMR
jgi:ABC-type spermidine/putrescine transport system permease subunit I